MRQTGGQVFKRLTGTFADALYPACCMACAEPVADPNQLCAACWGEARLIDGTVCDRCGSPMPLTLRSGDVIRCEPCQAGAAKWDRGRAASLYAGSARALVLALKHGDRPDIAAALGAWMTRSARELIAEADILVPIPLHWRRFLTRRYNQSAELSRAMAALSGLPHGPDLLRRMRPTEMQRARSSSARHRNVAEAFAVPRHMRDTVRGARILLVDDVLTTGATLNEATHALRQAGAAQVSIAVFTRVEAPTEK